VFDVCTLGAARIASFSPVASASVRAARIAGAIVINELDAHGVPQDRVELKNIGAVTCTLQGWQLFDQLGRIFLPARLW